MKQIWEKLFGKKRNWLGGGASSPQTRTSEWQGWLAEEPHNSTFGKYYMSATVRHTITQGGTHLLDASPASIRAPWDPRRSRVSTAEDATVGAATDGGGGWHRGSSPVRLGFGVRGCQGPASSIPDNFRSCRRGREVVQAMRMGDRADFMVLVVGNSGRARSGHGWRSWWWS
jgi:hypothetical protein